MVTKHKQINTYWVLILCRNACWGFTSITLCSFPENSLLCMLLLSSLYTQRSIRRLSCLYRGKCWPGHQGPYFWPTLSPMLYSLQLSGLTYCFRMLFTFLLCLLRDFIIRYLGNLLLMLGGTPKWQDVYCIPRHKIGTQEIVVKWMHGLIH